MDDTQLTAVYRMDRASIFSVPAMPISEGAAPCPTGLRPDRFTRFTSALPGIYFFVFHLQNVIAVVFSDSRCKNACAYRFVPMFSCCRAT